MFKKGDNIVCIDNDPNYGYDIYKNKIENLTRYKTYNVVSLSIDFDHYVKVIDDTNKMLSCDYRRFVSIEEFRRRKIEKLKKRCLERVTK